MRWHGGIKALTPVADSAIVINGQGDLLARSSASGACTQAALLDDKPQHDAVRRNVGARLQQANAKPALRDAVRHGVAIDAQSFGA